MSENFVACVASDNICNAVSPEKVHPMELIFLKILQTGMDYVKKNNTLLLLSKGRMVKGKNFQIT